MLQDLSSFYNIKKKLGRITRLADGQILGNLIALVVFHFDFDFSTVLVFLFSHKMIVGAMVKCGLRLNSINLILRFDSKFLVWFCHFQREKLF